MLTDLLKSAGGSKPKRHHLIKNGVWNDAEFPKFFGAINITQRADYIEINNGGYVDLAQLNSAYFKGAKKVRIVMIFDWNLTQYYGWFSLLSNTNFRVVPGNIEFVKKIVTNARIEFFIDLTLFSHNSRFTLFRYNASNNSYGPWVKLKEMWFEEVKD
ncbi:hypothetical protein EII25_03310 [Erysipelotrichaceae bacterium OH741_COT-311]|nr:hypothetical protein EII25_03310 [Erysipelotrichaceae bacterium OH741_COT-311]